MLNLEQKFNRSTNVEFTTSAPIAFKPLLCPSAFFRLSIFYLFPFALLCVLQSISQFLLSVAPPLLQAVTWSASISASFQIFVLLLSCPIAHNEQFEVPFFSASAVWIAYFDFLVASSNTLTSKSFVSVEPPKINSKTPFLFFSTKNNILKSAA